MGYNNRFTGAITITPPLTRKQIREAHHENLKDVRLRIVEQQVESDDGETVTMRTTADAIIPLDMEYSGHSLEGEIQSIVDAFGDHEFAGFIEAKWDAGFGEPPSRFIVKDDRVMRIDAQYRWPGIWPDEQPQNERDSCTCGEPRTVCQLRTEVDQLRGQLKNEREVLTAERDEARELARVSLDILKNVSDEPMRELYGVDDFGELPDWFTGYGKAAIKR